jgi:hypothetical protein
VRRRRKEKKTFFVESERAEDGAEGVNSGQLAWGRMWGRWEPANLFYTFWFMSCGLSPTQHGTL